MEQVDLFEKICVLPHPEVPKSIWGKIGSVTSLTAPDGEGTDSLQTIIGLEIDNIEIPFAFYRDHLCNEKDVGLTFPVLTR